MDDAKCIRTSKDGYCIIEACRIAMKDAGALAVPSRDGLLQMCKHEILNNFKDYLPFIDSSFEYDKQVVDALEKWKLNLNGKGPDFATLQIRKAGRAEERAINLGSYNFWQIA